MILPEIDQCVCPGVVNFDLLHQNCFPNDPLSRIISPFAFVLCLLTG